MEERRLDLRLPNEERTNEVWLHMMYLTILW